MYAPGAQDEESVVRDLKRGCGYLSTHEEDHFSLPCGSRWLSFSVRFRERLAFWKDGGVQVEAVF